LRGICTKFFRFFTFTRAFYVVVNVGLTFDDFVAAVAAASMPSASVWMIKTVAGGKNGYKMHNKRHKRQMRWSIFVLIVRVYRC
jgi:hypothetical protein